MSNGQTAAWFANASRTKLAAALMTKFAPTQAGQEIAQKAASL